MKDFLKDLIFYLVSAFFAIALIMFTLKISYYLMALFSLKEVQ